MATAIHLPECHDKTYFIDYIKNNFYSFFFGYSFPALCMNDTDCQDTCNGGAMPHCINYVLLQNFGRPIILK